MRRNRRTLTIKAVKIEGEDKKEVWMKYTCEECAYSTMSLTPIIHIHKDGWGYRMGNQPNQEDIKPCLPKNNEPKP